MSDDHPQTPQAVAYALLCEVARAESVTFGSNRTGSRTGDRRWILDTYAECLRATMIEPAKTAPTHGRSSF